jgi:hypothetical protein
MGMEWNVELYDDIKMINKRRLKEGPGEIELMPRKLP